MPGRIERINQILAEVEKKGFSFREILARLNDCPVEPGRVEILGRANGRAYFRRQPNGLPVWSDLTLVNSATNQPFGLNLDYSEYNEPYTGLKARHLAASQDKLALDETDALEALTLAVLVGDTAAADSLITRLARHPKLPATLEKLVEHGNTRLRSAYGRVLALANQPAAWEILKNHFRRETADGVRADIISATILNSQSDAEGLPVAILEEWLTGERLIDPLSCVLALTGLGLQLDSDIFGLIQPPHQPLLMKWFEPAAANVL